MASPRFLDTNILIRAFTNADPDTGMRARELLERIDRGEEQVVTSQFVIFETIFTLQRTYRVPREQVRDMVSDLLSVPGIDVPDRSLIVRALSTYVESAVSFVDAYNAEVMKANGIREIYTWDRDFDRLSGVTRIEP